MKSAEKTRMLTLAALMTAVLAILSPISLPIGVVPVTLGVFAVVLTGAMLPTMPAIAAITGYLLLGAIGLPVFSNYQGGLQVLVGPTGGYLFGYFVLAAVVSQTVRRHGKAAAQLAVIVLALAIFYVLGTVWYVVVTGSSFLSGLAVCVAPFVVPDLLKTAAALAVARALHARGSRQA